MPHEIYIDTETAQASMVYVGEAPWHGLGTKLDRPATAARAIEAAKLDWKVVKKPLVAVGDDATTPVPDRFAVVRQDRWGKPSCPVLGIVGRDYQPLQNREAFEFFDPIAGKGAAIYHTAGALGNGERVWILARLPEDIRIIGDDIAEKYLLLSNSHDGLSSVQIKFTPVRVVCQNTLTMALRQGPTVRVIHTKDIHERLRNAERMLRLVHGRYDEIEEAFQAMTTIQMNSDRLAQYLRGVFPDPRDGEDETARKRMRVHRQWAEYFFVQGKGNQVQGVKGSLWAAYNGIAEYLDHRGAYQLPDRRLNSAWFGGGYLAKARAFMVAQEQLRA
jgi:phage/plasmid-like protein (TIGR03299 family)